jgi:hypothetical protein
MLSLWAKSNATNSSVLANLGNAPTFSGNRVEVDLMFCDGR